MATRNGYTMAYIIYIFNLLIICFLFCLLLFISYLFIVYTYGMQIIGTYTSPTKDAWELMLVKQCHKAAIWNDGLCHP